MFHENAVEDSLILHLMLGKLVGFLLLVVVPSQFFAQDTSQALVPYVQKPLDSLIPPLTIDSMDLVNYYVVEDSAKYTVQMIYDDMDAFASFWPNQLSVFELGPSEYGTPIKGMRISSNKGATQSVLLVGNVHAREDFSSKHVMKFINIWMLSMNGKSKVYPNADSLMQFVDLYVIPVANPDGLMIAQEDTAAIARQFKQWKDSIYIVQSLREWKANGTGIDLNSSFDDGNWAVKKSGNYQEKRASEGYKGGRPAEAIEVQHLQNFVQALKPIVTLSFHTKGNVLYWADVATHDRFNGIDTDMAMTVSDRTKVKAASISKKPNDYGCGLENYVRSRAGSIGICVELASGGGGRTPHPDSDYWKEVWVVAWEVPWIFIEKTVGYRTQLVEIQQSFYGK